MDLDSIAHSHHLPEPKIKIIIQITRIKVSIKSCGESSLVLFVTIGYNLLSSVKSDSHKTGEHICLKALLPGLRIATDSNALCGIRTRDCAMSKHEIKTIILLTCHSYRQETYLFHPFLLVLNFSYHQ